MINEEKRKIQEEALEALKINNFNGIVILPTGTGKSFVLIESLRQLYKPGMRVLYTCDSTRLRDAGFDDELKKWNADKFCSIIEKKCYAAAYKLQGQEYDILLADEGDYALTPEYKKLFFNNKFKHIIFVSATLEPKKATIARKIAPIVYKKQVKEIEDRKVVNKAQFILVPYRLNIKENARYLQFNKKFKELLSYIEQTPHIKKQLEIVQRQRMHFLAELESSVYICRKLMQELYTIDPNTKLLIFCGNRKQADRVCKHSYHGLNEEDDNLAKFNNNEIKALSVVGKVNRGLNLVSVNSILMEQCTGSETLMIQRVGRGKRLDVDEILYVYLLIPYFKTDYGAVKATVVKDWIERSGKNMGIEKAKIHYVK